MRGLPLFVRRTSAAANRRVQDRGKPVVSVCPSPETKGDGLQVAHISDWLERVGAFLVGYVRPFGVLGIGVGSQIYIGQLLAYGAHWSTPTCGVSSLPR
jgi:hypothetical protein